jgi:hypothetical protein
MTRRSNTGGMQRQKNALYRGLGKDIFNRVRNAKDAYELWTSLCALHEGTKSEREEHYHIALKKINSFEMLPKESANDMYTHLNVLVEDLNALGLTQMSPSDVARRILSVLSIEKYGHIVTVLHQSDLSTATPTQVLGKIIAHEMYMHITPEEGSSSFKKKDLAFKASHDKKKKKSQAMIVQESTSDDDIDDASLALMVRKTTKMLKKLNKSGIKFDGKKKFFTSSKRKPISEMDCYNCGELGHLAHQCPKPPKDKYKYKNKGKKDDSSDEKEEKKKKRLYKKKDGKKKEYHKKKKGDKAYIVGNWLTDIESSCESSGDESDNEKGKVAVFVIGPSLSSSTSSPPPSPPSSPSLSTTHLCLMAKGERKIQSNDSDDNDDDSDSDDEFDASSYEEFVKLLNKYTKIIRKTRNENDELQNKNESLSSKLDVAQKISDELREQNKVVF